MDTVASTALDGFVHHGLPWMGKKAVEMRRYYGSEALRNPKLQKKAIDYALKILMEVLWIFTSRLVNNQDPQADGPYQVINTQAPTTISKTK